MKDASVITTITKEYVNSKTSTFPINNGRVRDFINILMVASSQPPNLSPVSIIYDGGNAGGLDGVLILNGLAGGVIYDALNS